MNKLTTLALLFLATTVVAQETDPPLEEAPVAQEPTLDQVVPVAEDEQMTVELPPELSPEDELIEQYTRYLQLMKDGVFDEADSVAKRVVELALEVKGPRSTDFAKALTNLAIVQHQTKQYDAAEQNFQSAIEIIEDNEDQLNAQLVNPLKGLGASQLESGRPDKATDTFQRAVHVTHVNKGPHNLDQIKLLESLSESQLRMGSIDDAKHIQDIIYALNERAYADNAVDMLPSLMRRADWQHRAGFINDQRTTLRRAVRIIETVYGREDMRLVEPLTQLGQSFFFVDISGSSAGTAASLTTGETHFKRALHIAKSDPDANWEMVADTSLALGDYYNVMGNVQQAQRIYAAAWIDLGDADNRLDYRREHLEKFVVLRSYPLPTTAHRLTEKNKGGNDDPLLQASVTFRYDVTERGRVENVKVVDANPPEFIEVHHRASREIRRRIYRPRYTDGQPVSTEGQIVEHTFFYRQDELTALRKSNAANTEET